MLCAGGQLLSNWLAYLIFARTPDHKTSGNQICCYSCRRLHLYIAERVSVFGDVTMFNSMSVHKAWQEQSSGLAITGEVKLLIALDTCIDGLMSSCMSQARFNAKASTLNQCIQQELCAYDLEHRSTSVGEAASTSLHSGKADLMRSFVNHSRRWTVSDPQVNILGLYEFIITEMLYMRSLLSQLGLLICAENGKSN